MWRLQPANPVRHAGTVHQRVSVAPSGLSVLTAADQLGLTLANDN
jgi:hypothetical protein